MENNIKKIREACIAANPSIKSTYHVSTGNNLRCKNCGEVNDYDNRGTCKNGEERPIRLADVLLALMEMPASKMLGIQTVQQLYSQIGLHWILTQDDLTLQSPETISFIAELLSSN